MPLKERYWKNPEHHRKECRERKRKLIALGYPSGVRNLNSYVKCLANSKNWQREHISRFHISSKKWSNKLRDATGGTSNFHKELFKLMGGADAYNKKMLQLPELQGTIGSLERALQRCSDRDKVAAEVRRSLDLQQVQTRSRITEQGKSTNVSKTRSKI